MRKHWSWWKFFASVVFFLFAVLLIAGLSFARLAGARVQEWNERFAATAGRTAFSLGPEFVAGVYGGVSSLPKEQTWLLLGTDEVEGSGREDVLTDTIMIVQYDPLQSAVRLVSLPRDWYLAEEQVKINGLYMRALARGEPAPAQIVAQEISERTGLAFTGTYVVRLVDIESLIDTVGGVVIDVPNPFTDERYPRSGVDVTRERDPAILYERLVFESGEQLMDGKRAVQYLRTRHSTQAGEGGDEARTRRQQQVIQALVDQVLTQDLPLQPSLLGSLYRWYSDRFESQLPLYSLGFLLGSLAQEGQVPKIEKIALPVTDLPRTVNEETLFVHPSEMKYRQWVYELVDPSGQQLRDFLQESGFVLSGDRPVR